MTDHRIAPPPAALLESKTAPDARTVTAEVRSDASLVFDPNAAPGSLILNNVAFGAIIQWRVDVSWSQAQQIQQWLIGAPAGGLFPTRQEALVDFFENLQVNNPPGVFLEYVGTYLTTGVSHASYTLVLGMKAPRTRDAYQTAFEGALNALLPAPPNPPPPNTWPNDLMNFLNMILNQPTSREEFLTLASNIGDLTGANAPAIVRRLIT
jgi:hypothetical protein